MNDAIVWEVVTATQRGRVYVLSVLNPVPLREHVWGMEVYVHAFLTSELDGPE
jgi:hypothetical protein